MFYIVLSVLFALMLRSMTKSWFAMDYSAIPHMFLSAVCFVAMVALVLGKYVF